MTKALLRTLILFFWAAPLCFGKAVGMDTAEGLLQEAYNNAKIARDYSTQANQLLDRNADRKTVEFAIGLYVKAGQLFERSAKIFEALGPENVGKDDLKGATDAMHSCMQSIEKLKKGLPKT